MRSGGRPGRLRSAAVIALALLALLPCACQAPADRYSRWLATGHNMQLVSDYAAHLQAAGVADVAPMQQLLRRGRRWRRCGGVEFAVPARAQWRHIVPTLAVVRDLRAANLIQGARIVSAWRDGTFNVCEGGSRGSKHLLNNAVDIEFDDQAGTVTQVCEYWRRHGAGRAFGLGFYTARKIHVDTSGYRTWGTDFRRRSSLCVRGDPAGQRRGR